MRNNYQKGRINTRAYRFSVKFIMQNYEKAYLKA